MVSQQVHYKKNMPDIEALMEAWPPEFEEILGNVNLLTPELEMSLEEYARMVSRKTIAYVLCQLPCVLSWHRGVVSGLNASLCSKDRR